MKWKVIEKSIHQRLIGIAERRDKLSNRLGFINLLDCISLRIMKINQKIANLFHLAQVAALIGMQRIFMRL